MYFNKKSPLAAHQVGDPLLHIEKIEMTGLVQPNIFGPGKSSRLTTWGRDEADPLFTPHWIAVRGSTPLHTDPRYPRYTHQLVVHGSVTLLGYDEVLHEVSVGSFFILDTHSPHQLKQKQGQLYAAASVDSKQMLEADTVWVLKEYAENKGQLDYNTI